MSVCEATATDPLLEIDGEVSEMQIRDSDFFSQLACWAGAGSAEPALEELGELFADRRFNERRGVMHYLGDEPIDVSSLPTLELPDTVLFPDESATLTVSWTDPLLRLVELGDAVVQLGDAPPATIVKFRPGFGQPREDDGVLDEVYTLGTVSVTARYGPGEASLHVLTSARVIGDQGEDDPLGRNPAYPVFGACADFPELRENFVKLIGESPGIDAVPGSNLLDTLEAIEQTASKRPAFRRRRLLAGPLQRGLRQWSAGAALRRARLRGLVSATRDPAGSRSALPAGGGSPRGAEGGARRPRAVERSTATPACSDARSTSTTNRTRSSGSCSMTAGSRSTRTSGRRCGSTRPTRTAANGGSRPSHGWRPA